MASPLDLVVSRLSLRPIHRIKHVVDIQQALPVNTLLPITIISAKDAPVLANTSEVETGSKVNGFYATVEVVGSETASGKTPNLYIYFAKNPGGNLTFPNGNVVGTNDNKRFVIHQEMVMLQGSSGGGTGVPRNVFKGVIVIPKGMRRLGPNDLWQMYMFTPSTGITLNICAQFHYKEFR